MIPHTGTLAPPALMAMLTLACGFSYGIACNSCIPIPVAAEHGADSPIAPRGAERFRRGLDHRFTEE